MQATPPVDVKALRDTLSKLYLHEADARRVAKDAGLAIERIDFSGSALTRWANIVKEAELQGMLDVLLRAAEVDERAPLLLRREVDPSRTGEDRTLALAFHIAQTTIEARIGLRHFLAALTRSTDPLVRAFWQLVDNGADAPSARRQGGEFEVALAMLDEAERARLFETPTLSDLREVEFFCDAPARAVLVSARRLSAQRGLDEAHARDLLIGSLAFQHEPAVAALVDIDLFGETLWRGENARITISNTPSPWRLPLAATTLPTGPGADPGGGLIDVMADALQGESQVRFISQMRDAAKRTPVSRERPVWVDVGGAPESWTAFPLQVALATANSPDDASLAALALCRDASERALPSLGIALFDSGDDGPAPVEVARAMFDTVRDAATRGETPPLVVLTTLDADVVRALRETSPDPEALRVERPPVTSFESPARPVPVPPPAPTPTPAPTHVPLWFTFRDGVCTLARPNERTPIWTRSVSEPWRDTDLSARGDARDLAAQWKIDEVRAFGDRLATALFGGPAPDAVRDALKVSSTGPAQRVVFDLDADASTVPWEYLRIGESFLLDRNVSLVRHVETEVSAPRPLTIGAAPTRVLFAIAAPEDRPPIDGLRDQAKIASAVQKIGSTLHLLSACTGPQLDTDLAQLARELGAFHFLGHGEVSGAGPVLIVHDAVDSKVHAEVGGEQLARWLQRTSARFVFLGACHSGEAGDDEFAGVAQKIVQLTGIPVVAMQLAVPQDFSAVFAAKFYELLQSEDWNLEAAVARARAVPHDGRHAFGIPVLFADVRNAPAPTPTFAPPKEWQPALVTVRFDANDVAEAIAKAMPLVATPRVIEKIQRVERPFTVKLSDDDDDDTKARKVRVIAKEAKLSDAERDALLEPLKARESVETGVPRRVDATPIEPVDEREIPRDWSRWKPALDALGKKYCVPASLLRRIVSELLAGRHVLLVGPVGTGKTSLAIDLCKALGYERLTATASADWTASDIVGGFWPQTDEAGKTRFEFRPGVFTEAVFSNWRTGPMRDGKRLWSRTLLGGRWLVLDELNRADMDRAMGALFTAMETRRLRVALPGSEHGGTTEVPIPKDFRVIATMNTADRHYLFKLSEALRRRFAFIEVPDALDFANEEVVVDARLAETFKHTPAEDLALHDLVWRFVRLARAAHPVGTASVLAAKTFLHASRDSGMSAAERVSQALLGSVVPILEDAGRDVAEMLLAWATTLDAAELRAKLDGLQTWRVEAVAKALRAQGAAVVEPHAEQIAQGLVRPKISADLDALPELEQRLKAIARETA